MELRRWRRGQYIDLDANYNVSAYMCTSEVSSLSPSQMKRVIIARKNEPSHFQSKQNPTFLLNQRTLFGYLKSFFRLHEPNNINLAAEKKDFPLNYEHSHISESRQSNRYLHRQKLTTLTSMTDSSSDSSSIPDYMIADSSYSSPPLIHPHQFQTSSNQKKFLKSVRVYALGICIFAFSSAVIGCTLGRSSFVEDHNLYQLDGISSRTTKFMDEDIHRKSVGKRRENGHDHDRSSNGSKNKKGKLAKAHHRDEGMLAKLRDEFHEWITHHGRDYGTEEEKEKRFDVWKENHFR